ncbi:uncharacterized protein LOC131958407 [Physella acuta]|uniref:uncharacterized protein LOC131958407 n=1 Tax=Physella acuta TaxID=109671 RepID=UPI0027DC0D86|nr:uncharacterized protein LOC131958407 [Physella acuta]
MFVEFVVIILLMSGIKSTPPTLEDLTALKCRSEKPFLCLPYGVCYNADSFCYHGSIESCFPGNITAEQLEQWCRSIGQHRPELMRDTALCSLACQARFSSLDLSNAVEKLVSIKCPADKPLKCLPAGICHGFDEYCHAGQNKSCFDGGMSEGELLRWCQVHGQDDVSSLPDPSCKFACQTKFATLFHPATDAWTSRNIAIGMGVLALVFFVWACTCTVWLLVKHREVFCVGQPKEEIELEEVRPHGRDEPGQPPANLGDQANLAAADPSYVRLDALAETPSTPQDIDIGQDPEITDNLRNDLLTNNVAPSSHPGAQVSVEIHNPGIDLTPTNETQPLLTNPIPT